MHSCNLLKRIILYLIIFFSFGLSAQENGSNLFNESSQSYSAFKNQIKLDSVLSFRSAKGYFPSLIHNLGYQAGFPLRMKGKDFITLGGTVIITLTLFNYDQKIDDYFKPLKDNNPFIKSVSPHFTELGDYYGYILLAGYGSYSIAFHNYKAFRTSLLASQAAITAGLWVRTIKLLTGRMRPGALYNDPVYQSDHWFGPFAQFNKKYNSDRGVAAFDAFPSGHTAAIFAMATVFSEQYKENKAVPVVLYSIAGIVGVTRLIEHEHWASDLISGAVIGYLCGKQIVGNENRLFPNYKVAQKKSRSIIIPFNSAGITGIEWRMIF